MPDDDEVPLRRKEKTREWNSFWHWRDKPTAERMQAMEILKHAGFDVVNLTSRGQDDPPDCEGILDGHWSAVEVTELVHQPTLKRSIKAVRERAAGREPKKPEAYFLWDRDALLDAIQERLDDKDKDAVKLKGGPYLRYVVVMHTNEFFLCSERVDQFLRGASFCTRSITDAILGLSYQGGVYPTFKLALLKI